jgi:CDP-glycerol glycerophosphotransferase (TagB/SpsB family)
MIILVLIFLSTFLITPAFAYLDPGTGSMLVYFIMGVFATFLYFIKGSFYKVKALLTGGKVDKDLRDLGDAEVLFYSEGAHYWNVFLPVIEELEKKSIKTVYYTSGENDPGLNTDFKYLKAKYIGKNITAFTLLNHIKAKLVVMTTPQLDIMHLKRSKKVDTYIHLVHAPTDALLYKKFAFDYFDVVMCSGQHQIESIEELEAKRNLHKKVLLKTGLTYYDIMYRNREKFLKKKNTNTILIAPTWGTNSMLTKFGSNPLKILLEAGYNLILRPHPQMYVSQKQLIEEIENELLEYNNVKIDKNPSGEASMGEADLLISDISGIIFDFFFIYEKPVIVIEDEIEKGGYEAEDVEKEMWEIEVLDKVATLVNHNNMDLLTNKVAELIDKDISDLVNEIRSESLFNFPNAGKVAAEQIIDIVKNIENYKKVPENA